MEQAVELGAAIWRRAERVRFPNGRWEMALSRALVRETEGRWEYALAYDGRSSFPLPDLFCFARFVCIHGENYIIYTFDKKNTPIF